MAAQERIFLYGQVALLRITLPTPYGVALSFEYELLLVAVWPDDFENRRLTQGSAFLILEGALKCSPRWTAEPSLGRAAERPSGLMVGTHRFRRNLYVGFLKSSSHMFDGFHVKL